MTRRDFSGKTVVITGAAAGLGRSLAQAFAAAGARVAALDRDAAGAEALAAELRQQGRQALGLACDVSDAAACERAMTAVIASFAGIDVLVNNAGISHRSAYRRTEPEVIRRVMEVNFFGSVHCTRAALDALIEARGLVIVISSVAGFAPLIARTGYAAAKHALHGFFDSLRSELADEGVGVLLVCPSFIATGIDRNALGGDGQPARHGQQIVGARARPEAIAADIVHAARSGRNLLLPGRMAKLAWWVSRLAPRYYARAMARRLRAEMDA
ncbi:MAG: SDR family oxidoreductase [Burkholderiales bacterium]|jgi:NAD(P)-dependent dehydrogenase (short-subunit alcohol dehydrogenase family)